MFPDESDKCHTETAGLMKIPVLDVARIVAVFGGPVGCAHACQSVGFSLPTTTVRKWIKRSRIPMDGWLMISKTHFIQRGVNLNLNMFTVVK